MNLYARKPKKIVTNPGGKKRNKTIRAFLNRNNTTTRILLIFYICLLAGCETSQNQLNAVTESVIQIQMDRTVNHVVTENGI